MVTDVTGSEGAVGHEDSQPGMTDGTTEGGPDQRDLETAIDRSQGSAFAEASANRNTPGGRSGEAPALLTEQVTALHASREALTALEARTKHLVPEPDKAEDDLDETLSEIGAGVWTGNYEEEDGRKVQLQMFGVAQDQEPFYLEQNVPGLPPEYGGLLVCWRGGVTKDDLTTGVSEKHDFYEVADEDERLRGGVVIVRGHADVIDDFYEPAAELKTILEQRVAEMDAAGAAALDADDQEPLFGSVAGQDVIWGTRYKSRGRRLCCRKQQ